MSSGSTRIQPFCRGARTRFFIPSFACGTFLDLRIELILTSGEQSVVLLRFDLVELPLLPIVDIHEKYLMSPEGKPGTGSCGQCRVQRCCLLDTCRKVSPAFSHVVHDSTCQRTFVPEKANCNFYVSMSLSTRSTHVRLCLRSSVKEITAISTSIRMAGRSPSVLWCRGNYPGWAPVLSAMTRL